MYLSAHNYFSYEVQPIGYTLLIDAAIEPLELSYVKDFLRITGNDDDALISNLIVVSRQYGERFTGRDFINKTWKTYLDRFNYCNNSVVIAKSKLQSITSIQYFKDDILTTIDPSVYYNTDDAEYSIVLPKRNKSWPDDVDARKQSIEIVFVSGYGPTATDVPQGIKQAMLAHIASMYENRGDCSDCDIAFKNSQAASLYKPYVISEAMIGIIDGLL